MTSSAITSRDGVWRRVRVDAARSATFEISTRTFSAPGGGVHVSIPHRGGRCANDFAAEGAAPRVLVRAGALVWARTHATGFSLLVGERDAEPHARAAVTYVAHTRSANADHVQILSSIEPEWRSRNVRPYAYALPRNGAHIWRNTTRSQAGAQGDALGARRTRALANIVRVRSRVPTSTWQVAAFIARELNSDAD